MRFTEILDWLLELVWDQSQRLIRYAASQIQIVGGWFQGLLFEMSDAERDERSGDEWLLSVIAYLEWREGKSWRKVHRKGERWNSVRWCYLDAVRLLNELRYKPESGPALVVLPTIEKRHRHLPSLVQVEGIVGVR